MGDFRRIVGSNKIRTAVAENYSLNMGLKTTQILKLVSLGLALKIVRRPTSYRDSYILKNQGGRALLLNNSKFRTL